MSICQKPVVDLYQGAHTLLITINQIIPQIRKSVKMIQGQRLYMLGESLCKHAYQFEVSVSYNHKRDELKKCVQCIINIRNNLSALYQASLLDTGDYRKAAQSLEPLTRSVDLKSKEFNLSIMLYHGNDHLL